MASTTLPAASAFTGASVTEGAFKTALTDLRTMINEVLGDNSTGTQGAKAGFVMLGSAYINDSSNAQMTLGLTINQGAADNEILALKSSDVAHGMTSETETDSFGFFRKRHVTEGGLQFEGLAGGNSVALYMAGAVSAASTTKSAAGLGAVCIGGALKSGTSTTSLGADGNIIAFLDGATTRFILDADGDSHQDVGTAWTNFDAHEDVALLNALSVHVSRPGDPIKHEFKKFLKINRKKLQSLNLVTFNRDGHHFVNMSKLTMLHTGAIRQLGERKADRGELAQLRALTEKLVRRTQRLENRLAA